MTKDVIYIIRDTETGKIWYNNTKCAWVSKSAAVNAWQLHSMPYGEEKGSFAKQTRYVIEEVR